jgi:hypothetical protein
MSFTVVPVMRLRLPVGTEIQFASAFVLSDIPEWVKSSLEFLSHQDRFDIMEARHALISEYDTYTRGNSDPDWTGIAQRTIQETKLERALQANLSLWLAQPSSVCLKLIFHARSSFIPGVPQIPTLEGAQMEPSLCCHPNDKRNIPSLDDVTEAGKIHHGIIAVPRNNELWTAMRTVWAGLVSPARDIRYAMFWIGLEALFGANDTREVGYKLAQRIAFFLSSDPESARILFKQVKKCYAIRSAIAHGKWGDSKEFDDRMADTESIARRSLLKITQHPSLTQLFSGSSKKRDEFLEDFVFSHARGIDWIPT